MRVRHLLLATATAVLPSRAYALAAVVDNLDDIPEALKAEYTEKDGKYHLQVTGMPADPSTAGLRTSLEKERKEHTALKQRVKDNFGDDKFEDIRATLDRVPELEAAAKGKLDEDKINEIVEGRVKTRLAPVERERDKFRDQLNERDQKIGELTTKERNRMIDDAVRDAAVKAKVTPEALDDALLLGRTVLEVREDDGKVVVKDGAQFTVGIEPTVLFSDLQSKKPHWFGPSVGGGAGGQRQGPGGGGGNPFTAENWNVTQQGQLMQTDPAKAEQFARAAGHKEAATATKPAPAK